MSSIEKRTILIAVYGTLRTNQWNYQRFFINNAASFVGDATLKGFSLYAQNKIPYIVKDPENKDCVYVECFKITPSKLRELDMLEGFIEEGHEDNVYDRETVETPFGDAYIYVAKNVNQFGGYASFKEPSGMYTGMTKQGRMTLPPVFERQNG
jgi:gamma-glutamylcyclotransferase (GGCT)/AIG2-like uncharacterized protein YtfP